MKQGLNISLSQGDLQLPLNLHCLQCQCGLAARAQCRIGCPLSWFEGVFLWIVLVKCFMDVFFLK